MNAGRALVVVVAGISGIGCAADVAYDPDSSGVAASSGSGGMELGSSRPSWVDANLRCGERSCCAYAEVPGGSFNRSNDPAFPATVSSFHLDLYEVTVGRMRAFVDHFGAWKPLPGAGGSPYVPGTGWDGSLKREQLLPASAEMLRYTLRGHDAPHAGPVTWTDAVGPYEDVPVGWLSWSTAQAFCIWDGGRLPTEAEWNYAAVGGAEQREYAWGSEPPSAETAVLDYVNDGQHAAAYSPAGSAPAGAGRWGHLDFGGSRLELLFDANNVAYPEDVSPLRNPCQDCIQTDDDPGAPIGNVVRDATALRPLASDGINVRDWSFAWNQVDGAVGFRCVHGSSTAAE